MKYLMILPLVLALSAPAFAAPAATADKGPAQAMTKLEAFSARAGTVVVRGTTSIGVIRGIGTAVEVQARELRDPANPKSRATGILVQVLDDRRNIERAFIDADEIDGLLQGIDYMSKITKDVTSHKNYEAAYETRGGLELTVFGEGDGSPQLSIAAGRVTPRAVVLSLRDLAEFRRLVSEAKGKL